MVVLSNFSDGGASFGGGNSGDRLRRDRAEAEHYFVDVGVATRGHAPRVCTVHGGFLREEIIVIAKARVVSFSLLVSLSSDCFGFSAVRWSRSDNDNGSTVAG